MKRQALQFLAVLIAAASLLFLFHTYADSKPGRFIPVQDEGMRTNGVVFDTTTGMNCSTYQPTKRDIALRAIEEKKRSGQKLDQSEKDADTWFRNGYEKDEKSYARLGWYLVYGSCSR